MKPFLTKLSVLLLFSLFISNTYAQYQMEKLDRGVVAVRSGSNNFISWRWLGNEDDISFNLYRNGSKVNSTPLTVTNYTDNGASANASYTVRAVVGGSELSASTAVTPWAQQYLKIPITAPAGGTAKDGVAYTYVANDASVADLDGDGTLEVILKWDPTNSKDNSQSGYTGNTFLDAYKMNGTRMWRIDYGINIRSGAHYMDFMAYDFDGDGKAEIMSRTADGTKDGTGKIIGSSSADYRNTSGYVLSGPEFISVFNGLTGAVMATKDYLPARGTVSSWGDAYGNRVDRFRAGVAYLDGQRPSGIFCRGYYTRAVTAAWDWRNGQLTNRWTFDSGTSSSNAYYSQGDHSLSVADVDGDGKHEIIVGSAIIDDNGTGYYSTKFGHGDALHVSDLDPSLPGLEVFNIQEPVSDAGAYMYSAKEKKVLWQKASVAGSDEGPGRGVSADISAKWAGAECWVIGGGVTGQLMDCKGNIVGNQPASGGSGPTCNFLVWWNGDLLREMFDDTRIDNYDLGRILVLGSLAPVSSNNGSKKNPCLSGDLIGDWREEIMMRATDNTALYLFTTTTPTTYKFRTFLHDPQYRVAIAWQNTGYNQPPHLSYFLGDGMSTPAKPNITIIGGSAENLPPTASITSPATNASFTAPASITINANATDSDGSIARVEFYNGTTKLGEDATSTYSYTWTNVPAGTYSLTVKAVDDDGAVTTSTAITAIVSSTNTGPTVSIISPTNNSQIQGAPATINLTATASDADGTVSKVEFYSGTSLIGGTTTSPYTYSWPSVVSGTYTITAVATDNGGATSTSTAITVTIVDVPTDCNGVPNGTATTDLCDRCVGGNTGKAACQSVLEAENACAFDGVEETKNEGYNGASYINVPNSIGSSITFVLAAANAGNATISFRYANGGTVDRPGSLTINNVAIPGTLAFPVTGSFIDWSVSETTVFLMAGNNIIKLSSTTADGLPNMDQLGLISTGLSVGNCSVITSLEDNELDDHAILFPNPSSKEFNLVLSTLSEVNIMTAQGVQIEHVKETTHHKFGENYASGVYFVQVNANGNSKMYRIVKK